MTDQARLAFMRARRRVALTPSPLPQGEEYLSPSPCGRRVGMRAWHQSAPEYFFNREVPLTTQKSGEQLDD